MNSPLLSATAMAAHQHRIALVSDFFYPRVGGVETHMWALAQCLLAHTHSDVELHAEAAEADAIDAAAKEQDDLVTDAASGGVVSRKRNGRPRRASQASSGRQGGATRSTGAADDPVADSTATPTHGPGAAGRSLKPHVIVITHSYDHATGPRVGVRYMTNGLKVYYIPAGIMADAATLPSYFSHMCVLRDVLARERINIVHGHAATSIFVHDCFLIAQTLGYKCVFTDHSLFGFTDLATININKYSRASLANVHHCITVSKVGRENLVWRTGVDVADTSVIPNAVDASRFTPAPRPPRARETSIPPRITIVMLNRLVYRKGVDLAAAIIPKIAKAYPHVQFLIGGDGPKRLLLEEMREKHEVGTLTAYTSPLQNINWRPLMQLFDRVHLLGALPHSEVRDLLIQGDIFLNCSLTEAFCIAILEAASCGCFVVSTNVGGIPEVLPAKFVELADPNADSLEDAMKRAIEKVATHSSDLDPYAMHEEIRSMYNWQDVARRTTLVYDKVAARPAFPLHERLRRYSRLGPIYGSIMALIMALVHLIACLLEWWWPTCTIPLAVCEGLQ